MTGIATNHNRLTVVQHQLLQDGGDQTTVLVVKDEGGHGTGHDIVALWADNQPQRFGRCVLVYSEEDFFEAVKDGARTVYWYVTKDQPMPEFNLDLLLRGRL